MADDKRTTIKHSDTGTVAPVSERADVAAFLDKAKQIQPGAGGRGRVILSLDATMSRQPTWDLAAGIQAQMFKAAAKTGTLSMQLVYFRGFGECRASAWQADGEALANAMARIQCRAGHTQIAKVLRHGEKTHAKTPVSAMVYIGDAMEENADELGAIAGRLGLRKLPVFVFQEGHDRTAEAAFREIARLSNGGWFRFDRSSADVLTKLLSSVAVYASGGLKALQDRNTHEDRLLLEQMKGSR